jgi:hypothetical protein
MEKHASVFRCLDAKQISSPEIPDSSIVGARWCGYCQRGIPECVCPPWMPNTGTDAERADRGARQEAERIGHMALSSKEKQEAFRARRAMLGMTEVRGVYLPPELGRRSRAPKVQTWTRHGRLFPRRCQMGMSHRRRSGVQP